MKRKIIVCKRKVKRIEISTSSLYKKVLEQKQEKNKTSEERTNTKSLVGEPRRSVKSMNIRKGPS